MAGVPVVVDLALGQFLAVSLGLAERKGLENLGYPVFEHWGLEILVFVTAETALDAAVRCPVSLSASS